MFGYKQIPSLLIELTSIHISKGKFAISESFRHNEITCIRALAEISSL